MKTSKIEAKLVNPVIEIDINTLNEIIEERVSAIVTQKVQDVLLLSFTNLLKSEHTQEQVNETEPVQEELPLEVTGSVMDIPKRPFNGKEVIAWSSFDEEKERRVVQYIIRDAYKQIGNDVFSANKFKKLGSDYNAVYQRIGKNTGKAGGWTSIVKEYI